VEPYRYVNPLCDAAAAATGGDNCEAVRGKSEEMIQY
jgi:hypothetical protein